MEIKKRNAVGALIALVLCTVIIIGLSSALTYWIISNVASVRTIGVGVYGDQACSNTVSSINWGVVDPGSNINKTVYIRNEGNTAASLAMTTSNWSPSNASSYINVKWNYNGQTLYVNEVIQVKLTLSVSSSIAGITNFNFDITIRASG